MTGLSLTFLANEGNQALTRVLRPIDIAVVEAGIAHELGEEAGVGGHTTDANAHVCVDFKYFLLMDSEVMWALFQSDEHLHQNHSELDIKILVK